MAKIYARKIHDGAMNEKTGEAWKLEDVPARWREAVRVELADDGDNYESLIQELFIKSFSKKNTISVYYKIGVVVCFFKKDLYCENWISVLNYVISGKT